MTDLEQTLLAIIDPERIKTLALHLAAIPSPTGSSAEVAAAYAAALREGGLDVEMVEDCPGSPSVVARLAGAGGGPTLQLCGHLDTIPIPHAPPWFSDGLLYGRGTADMKGALAAIAECARVLAAAPRRLKGSLLVTGYGLHEAPTGLGQGLSALIRRGIKGDAAIVAEMGSRALPVAGKGMGIFEITVRRQGESVHEMQAAAGTPNPILVAQRLLAELQARAEELASVPLPYVGPESIFLGMIHSGDFYNRVPVTAVITGTRRHGPDKSFSDVRSELEGICRRVQEEQASPQITIELSFTPVRESFRISADEPIAQVVQAAYKDLTGASLPVTGTSTVADAPQLIREAGIPAVYHGPWSDRAHADLEYIALDELVRVAKLYTLVAVRFCGIAEG